MHLTTPYQIFTGRLCLFYNFELVKCTSHPALAIGNAQRRFIDKSEGVRLECGDAEIWSLYARPRISILKFTREKARAFVQFCQVQLGYKPISHAGCRPVDQVVSLTCQLLLFPDGRAVRWPDKQINEVLAALINQCRDWPAVEVIQTAAN